MSYKSYGKIILGPSNTIQKSYDQWAQQPIDWDLMSTSPRKIAPYQKTIAEPVSVTGPGTFFGKAKRTVTLRPTHEEGWWFDRTDLPDALPVKVSIRNVWTTGAIVSNIVLRSGSPHNYIRLVEHIIALKLGTGIDNLMIQIDSGDPPLFNQGSLDLVEAFERAGTEEQKRSSRYITVKETVTVTGPHGSFLTLAPCEKSHPVLNIDCAIHFKTAIRKQRIKFPLNYEHFRYGSVARTNTSFMKMFYCKTIGMLFADIRNLGYSPENLLIAGRFGYYNKPQCSHEGKSLEAVWHRAILDLLAALALIEEGHFVGNAISYKAGHWLDVQMIRQLYKHDLLTTAA
ncbi:MAG: hypothetical protein GKR87_00590 [Kiritimatiellae bacterium]|nr:hypothetical protein [Kiritimatiellia bacterium]